MATSTTSSSFHLFKFMEQTIASLKLRGCIRSSEAYSSTLRSLRKFTQGEDVAFDKIDIDLIAAYEAFLLQRGVTRNTSSFYIRILRTIYKRAVDYGIAHGEPEKLFKEVYTGIDKTLKRALPTSLITKIKEMDLSFSRALTFARDMFLFSFYTRGMSFVDIAYLRKSDICDGFIYYFRRKTGTRLIVKVERCMEEIIERYKYKRIGSPFLLPIIKNDDENAYRQYVSASHMVNRSLRRIGRIADLDIPLTMYVARHSWANAARRKNIPLSIISEGMGHSSEKTTKIYLDELDNNLIDRANRKIISSI